jgi:hypothetical protein
MILSARWQANCGEPSGVFTSIANVAVSMQEVRETGMFNVTPHSSTCPKLSASERARGWQNVTIVTKSQCDCCMFRHSLDQIGPKYTRRHLPDSRRAPDHDSRRRRLQQPLLDEPIVTHQSTSRQSPNLTSLRPAPPTLRPVILLFGAPLFAYNASQTI